MAEHYKPNLGQTPTPDARRDAVHIAVAPVVAGHDLYPSFHVGLDKDGIAWEADISDVTPIGVVDPFRKTVVLKGETFWLFLYPDTITNLRHVWSHPAFKAKVPTIKEKE